MGTPHFHWFLPSDADSRGLVPGGRDRRPPSLDYLSDVARAAERNGFESVLASVGTRHEDAWVVSSALIGATRTLKFLISIRPEATLPVILARQAATFQRLSGDRLLLNFATGSSRRAQRAHGDFLEKEMRYERTDEFIQVLKRCWQGESFYFSGKYYSVEHGGQDGNGGRAVPIFFAGASEAAERVAARHADVQLMWGETPALAGRRIESLRRRAEGLGRKVSFGIRFHVITRKTSAAAWRTAHDLLAELDPAEIVKAQTLGSSVEAEGARRLSEAHRSFFAGAEPLEIYPNVWSGPGLVRNASALVGSHQEVAGRIREYMALGIEHFILSSYPNLEGAYEVGEGVLPLLRQEPPAAGARARDGKGRAA